MSTQINSYVVLGVRLDYKEFNKHIKSLCEDEWEAHETFVEPYCDSPFKGEPSSHNGLTMLYDGRDGEYVIIGEVLHKTANHEWFTSPVEIDFHNVQERAVVISDKIFEHFEIRESSKLIVVSHFR